MTSDIARTSVLGGERFFIYFYEVFTGIVLFSSKSSHFHSGFVFFQPWCWCSCTINEITIFNKPLGWEIDKRNVKICISLE